VNSFQDLLLNSSGTDNCHNLTIFLGFIEFHLVNQFLNLHGMGLAQKYLLGTLKGSNFLAKCSDLVGNSRNGNGSHSRSQGSLIL